MKTFRLLSFLAACLLAATVARAQWQTVSYTLHGGWNAIYLHGDASHTTIDQLVTGHTEVLRVWRWNVNPNPIQFGSSSLIPTAGTADWSVWVNGQPGQTTFSTLTGRSAYLIECSGVATDNYTLLITQKVMPPQSTWVRNGANFLGFPTRFSASSAYPTFTSYFATFPVATATNTKIYKYVGGPLNGDNPMQIFSPNFEPLDRNQAYWFDTAVVGDFYAPLEVSPSNLSGLVFGRTGAQITVRVRNRTAATVNLTVAPVTSAAAPVGQTQITAPVPLTRHEFDSSLQSYVDNAVTGPFGVVIPPQSSVELVFGVDRSLMTGAADAFYASMLRFTDSGNLMDVSLPVTAQVTSFAGLWVGDVAVTNVNRAPAPAVAEGSGVPASYPLRVLVHVDNTGKARLLSQVYLGRLAPAPYEIGICTQEAFLKADDLANSRRFVAAHMPLDLVLSDAMGSGNMGLGQTMTRSFTVLFTDRTNPYVHTYHPDHDNRDARFAALTTAIEAPTIGRTASFAFALTPPTGMSSVGWGSSVMAGTYTETITGLHKETLTVSGSFEFRRVSEIGSITTQN